MTTKNESGGSPPSERREQILQTLALMLQGVSSKKITTAGLAEKVGVSEAALYRHFPSKAKMYDALFDFIEDTIFSRITQILNMPLNGPEKCRQILELLLLFAEKNPGLSRLLTGDVLVGENDRLRKRSAQIGARFETQLKQLLREEELNKGLRTHQPIAVCANQLCAFVDGKILQYVRSEYAQRPSTGFDLHWAILASGLIVRTPE